MKLIKLNHTQLNDPILTALADGSDANNYSLPRELVWWPIVIQVNDNVFFPLKLGFGEETQ